MQPTGPRGKNWYGWILCLPLLELWVQPATKTTNLFWPAVVEVAQHCSKSQIYTHPDSSDQRLCSSLDKNYPISSSCKVPSVYPWRYSELAVATAVLHYMRHMTYIHSWICILWCTCSTIISQLNQDMFHPGPQHGSLASFMVFWVFKLVKINLTWRFAHLVEGRGQIFSSAKIDLMWDFGSKVAVQCTYFSRDTCFCISSISFSRLPDGLQI